MLLAKLLITLSFLGFSSAEDCSRANSLFNDNLYDDALLEILSIGGIELSSEECLLLSYNILYKLENFNEAKNYLDKLLQLDSGNTYQNLSVSLTKVLQNYKSAKYTLEKIDVDEAISEYKKILEDDELSKISLFYGGLGLAYKKKYMNSLDLDSLDFTLLDLSVSSYIAANELRNKYDSEINNIAKYLTNLGKTSASNDELSSALSYYKKATEYDNNYNVAHFYLGQLYMKIQDYDLAIESFKLGLGNDFEKGNYKILYLLASCYQKNNSFDDAEKFFNLSINNEPTYTKARFALANLFYKKQNFSKSKTEIFDLLKINSSYIKAYELLVNIFLDEKDYDSARKYANEGISVDPKSFFLYSQLAFLDNEEQKFESAIDNSNQALSLKRNYGPALIALATANVYLCNKIAADDAFKKAKRYDRRQVKQLQDWAAQHYKSPACN